VKEAPRPKEARKRPKVPPYPLKYGFIMRRKVSLQVNVIQGIYAVKRRRHARSVYDLAERPHVRSLSLSLFYMYVQVCVHNNW